MCIKVEGKVMSIVPPTDSELHPSPVVTLSKLLSLSEPGFPPTE